MKHLKKMMALALAMIMVLAMGVTVFASDTPTPEPDPVAEDTVSITVTRDTTTYNGEADADSRNFTWYKVFSASYGDDFTGNSNGDGGYNATTGAPLAPTGDTTNPVSYTATPAVAAALGTIDATTHAWTTKAGNLWFDLTYIPGTGNYSVTWRKDVATDAATAQAAAKWLVANGAYEDTGSLAFSGSGNTAAWSADGLDKGYYVLESEAGDNLIAATTDVEVKEKNEYPPLDKKQGDEDTTENNVINYSDDPRAVAIGDVLDYQVTVTIPKTAKVGDQILVWDKASQGLDYNDDLVATPATDVTDPASTLVDSSWTWSKLITVTAANKGTDVVFTFTMTVNDDALVDTGKENESGLKYGRGTGDKPFPYESTPDKVEYKTYFAGIHKIDGATEEDLEGVKFELKEAGVAFNVTKVSGEDYYIPGGSSNEVVTDANGMIKIRGLDNDKTYTLTETETLPGYNMLDADVTLTLHEDTTTSITYTPAASYDASATYYTKSGDNYVEATVDQATFEAAAEGTYFTKTESSTGSYTGATDTSWSEVENNKGSILPSTGGIGTTIFYVIGAILVLGAGILLVTRRRMNAN